MGAPTGAPLLRGGAAVHCVAVLVSRKAWAQQHRQQHQRHPFHKNDRMERVLGRPTEGTRISSRQHPERPFPRRQHGSTDSNGQTKRHSSELADVQQREHRPPHHLPNPASAVIPPKQRVPCSGPKRGAQHARIMHAQSGSRSGISRLNAAHGSDHARHERMPTLSRTPHSQPHILRRWLAVRLGPANQSTRRLHGAALPRSLTELLVSRGRAECNRAGGALRRISSPRHCLGGAIGPERWHHPQGRGERLLRQGLWRWLGSAARGTGRGYGLCGRRTRSSERHEMR